MEPQKTLNSQSKLKKEQTWMCRALRLETILQSYSNPNSMLQAKRQKQKQTPQNKQQKNRHTDQ